MAKDVTLKTYLPLGFKYLDNEYYDRFWSVGDLKPGEIKTLTYSLLAVNAEEKIHDNRVYAQASNHGQVEANTPVEVKEVIVLGIDSSEDFLLPVTGLNLSGIAIILLIVLSLIMTRLIIKKYA